jgi:DMATS type aromatic prenyltransferase
MTIATEILCPEEEAFQLLDKYSWFPNDDQRRWWEYTGPNLVKLLRDAQYPQKDWLPCLYLLQQLLVPYLGTFPVAGQAPLPWWSNVTTYGVPFELSWNLLNNIVRIGFEPLSHFAESGVDASNMIASDECLTRLAYLTTPSI